MSQTRSVWFKPTLSRAATNDFLAASEAGAFAVSSRVRVTISDIGLAGFGRLASPCIFSPNNNLQFISASLPSPIAGHGWCLCPACGLCTVHDVVALSPCAVEYALSPLRLPLVLSLPTRRPLGARQQSGGCRLCYHRQPGGCWAELEQHGDAEREGWVSRWCTAIVCLC